MVVGHQRLLDREAVAAGQALAQRFPALAGRPEGALVIQRFDTKALKFTGEPVPVSKATGDKVTGATVNGNGSLVIRAERVGADTLLARIVHMVGEAQRTRAPIQRQHMVPS